MSMKFRHLSMQYGGGASRCSWFSCLLYWFLCCCSHTYCSSCISCALLWLCCSLRLWSLNACCSSWVSFALLSASWSLRMYLELCLLLLLSLHCHPMTVLFLHNCSLASHCSRVTSVFWCLRCSLAHWSLASHSASVSHALLCLRWSLSLSSLALRCAGVSPAFCLPIIGVLGLSSHCSLFTGNMNVAAWACAMYQYQHINIMWLGRTRSVGRWSVGHWSVGRCTCSHRPR